MIRRIVQPRLARHGQTYAFARGSDARPLRIFLDTATITDGDSLQVLLGFAHHDQVEIVSPDGQAPIRVTVHPYDDAIEQALVDVSFPDGSGWRGGVWGRQRHEMARRFAPAGQEAEAERALYFALAAEENGADAVATESSLLLDGVFPANLIAESNVMSPEDAVALLGLFLRVREDFAFEMGEGWREAFDRGMFYFVLMRELLPSGWRWFSGIVANSTVAQDDELLFTAQSAMERVERALRARDRMHEKLQVPPSRDAATEAIFYFDVALMMLGGAFDGLARVAHAVHQLSGSPRGASWSKKTWLRKLAATNQPLGLLMSPEQPHRDARELVAILRNTIHSQALRTITHQSGGTRDELVVVPREIERELEDVLARLGDASLFGVERRSDGHLYIRPGVYIEVVLPLVGAALNAIMEATPVEQLPGVDPAQLTNGPRNDRVFTPENRRRVWQLGGIS